MINRFIALTFLCIAPLGSFCFGQDKEPSALERINQQVTEQSDKLTKLETLQVELEQQRLGLRQNLQKLQAQEQARSSELSKLSEQQRGMDREMSQADVEIKRLHELSILRVKTLYMNRGAGAIETLLAGNSASISRDAFYLTRIDKFDRTVAQSLRDLLKSRGQKKQELDKVLAERAKVKEALSTQRFAISQQVSAQEKLISSIKSQRNLKEGILTSLRAQALRLETLVSTLTGGPEAVGIIDKSTKEAKEKSQPAQAPTRLVPASEASSTAFDGQGLAGQLVSPVAGKLVSAPGGKKAGFDSLVAKKGVEFSTDPGSDVRAVAKGRVMFVGRMPAYGMIMILDHGLRFYTLYGRLSSTLATVGSVIEQGAIIAKSGTDDGAPSLYFEVRKNGQTVNPKPFFKGKI